MAVLVKVNGPLTPEEKNNNEREIKRHFEHLYRRVKKEPVQENIEALVRWFNDKNYCIDDKPTFSSEIYRVVEEEFPGFLSWIKPLFGWPTNFFEEAILGMINLEGFLPSNVPTEALEALPMVKKNLPRDDSSESSKSRRLAIVRGLASRDKEYYYCYDNGAIWHQRILKLEIVRRERYQQSQQSQQPQRYQQQHFFQPPLQQSPAPSAKNKTKEPLLAEESSPKKAKQSNTNASYETMLRLLLSDQGMRENYQLCEWDINDCLEEGHEIKAGRVICKIDDKNNAEDEASLRNLLNAYSSKLTPENPFLTLFIPVFTPDHWVFLRVKMAFDKSDFKAKLVDALPKPEKYPNEYYDRNHEKLEFIKRWAIENDYQEKQVKKQVKMTFTGEAKDKEGKTDKSICGFLVILKCLKEYHGENSPIIKTIEQIHKANDSRLETRLAVSKLVLKNARRNAENLRYKADGSIIWKRPEARRFLDAKSLSRGKGKLKSNNASKHESKKAKTVMFSAS